MKTKDSSARGEADLEARTVSVATISTQADVLGAIKAAGYDATAV